METRTRSCRYDQPGEAADGPALHHRMESTRRILIELVAEHFESIQSCPEPFSASAVADDALESYFSEERAGTPHRTGYQIRYWLLPSADARDAGWLAGHYETDFGQNWARNKPQSRLPQCSHPADLSASAGPFL